MGLETGVVASNPSMGTSGQPCLSIFLSFFDKYSLSLMPDFQDLSYLNIFID